MRDHSEVQVRQDDKLEAVPKEHYPLRPVKEKIVERYGLNYSGAQ